MTKRIHARLLVAAATVVSSFALSRPAVADSLFWDADGAGANIGGTGTWDTTSSLWRSGSAVGALTTWTDGANDATFTGAATGSNTVTIPTGETRTASTVTFLDVAPNTGIYTVTGGTLNLTNPTSSIVLNTATTFLGTTIASNITGGDITVANNILPVQRAQLSLSGNNTFTGDLILGGTTTGTAASNGNYVAINSATALPSTATVKFQRNFSQLLFGSGTTVNATFNNNINLNSTGTGTNSGSIAVSQGSVTLGGVISGSSNLAFQFGLSGGAGTLVLNNHATYTGQTNMILQSNATQAGIVRLGVDNALPQTTTLSYGTGGNQPTGFLDLAGFNQRIGTLTQGSTSTTFLGGVTNTTGTLSTLTIDGVGTGTYRATIGESGPGIVATGNNNVALALASTNTGTLTLAGNDNKYNGGTTVNGGTLLAGNTAGSATGTNTVTVNNGGRLGSTVASGGFIGGLVNVTSGGTLVPGGVGAIGNLTLNNVLTAQSGANINFDIGGTTDLLTLAAPIDSGIIATPGGTQSVNLNMLDAGGLTEGGIYTLINYPAALPGHPSLTGLDVSASGALKVNAPISGYASAANFALTNDAANHVIKVTVTGLADKTSWRGDAGSGSGMWNISGAVNFDKGGTPIDYTNPDEVTFDDSTNAGTNPAIITIAAGGVAPGKVTVSGARNFTFTGGPISGTTQIVKSGTGTLILGNNNHSGGTTITQGTLRLDSDADLGAIPATPTVNLTVSKTASTNATFLVFDAAMTMNVNRTVLLTQTNGSGPSINTNGFDVSILGQIQGGTNSVNLIKNGTGVLTLRGNNATNAGGGFINAVLVNGGFINANADANLGQAGTNFTMNAGGLQLGGSFSLGSRLLTANAGGGTVDTNGFNASTSGALAGAGAFTKNGGGTLTLNGTNTHTGGVTVNAGALEIKRLHAEAFTVAGGTLRVLESSPNYASGHPSGNNAFVSTPTSLAIANNAAPLGTRVYNGKLDLTNNDLIIDYTGASPILDIEDMVRAGFNGGDFLGNGITTSIGEIDNSFIIAVADNASLAAPFGTANGGTTFSGVDVDLTSVLVKFTNRVDLNLDGVVTPADATIFGTNFDPGQPAIWATGDLDYDGFYTPNDATIFGTFYDPTLESLPEPGSLALIGLLGLGLARRRRQA